MDILIEIMLFKGVFGYWGNTLVLAAWFFLEWYKRKIKDDELEQRLVQDHLDKMKEHDSYLALKNILIVVCVGANNDVFIRHCKNMYGPTLQQLSVREQINQSIEWGEAFTYYPFRKHRDFGFYSSF